VARGLLQAGRFNRVSLEKERNETERRKAFELLRNALDGDDPTCLGAVGLIERDFTPKLPFAQQ
jgi:hypothetical protein